MAITKEWNGNHVNTEKVYGIAEIWKTAERNHWFPFRKYKTAASMLQALADLRKKPPVELFDCHTGTLWATRGHYECYHVYYNLFFFFWGLKHKEK